MLAHDGDAVGGSVLDEHAAVAIEHESPRGAECERPLVIVLRHLGELVVLDDLENPEADAEYDEGRRDHRLQHGQPRREPPPIFDQRHDGEVSLPDSSPLCASALNGSRKNLGKLEEHDPHQCVPERPAGC